MTVVKYIYTIQKEKEWETHVGPENLTKQKLLLAEGVEYSLIRP